MTGEIVPMGELLADGIHNCKGYGVWLEKLWVASALMERDAVNGPNPFEKSK